MDPSMGNLWGAKKRRTLRIAFEDKDYNEDSNSMDRLTRGNSNMVGGKVDECLKGNNSLDCNAVSKDCILPSEDANVRAEYTSTTHDETSRILERVQSDSYREETSQKCVGNDKGENLTPKRKSTVTDKCSDVTATLVYKRIRRTSNVDQPTSKSTDEKSCARIMEDSGRPQGNNVEDGKIRSQHKSLHLSLKLEIAKLCEILLLPDNVKSMVGKILEYIMNNCQICAEPVTTRLQAFQLSLCFTAASLLKHKLDIEASLILAKKHLNFDCKMNAVDKINSMMWDLRETQKPMEKAATSNESQKRKNQWRKLLEMQLENKNKLKKDIETKEADFAKRYKIELGAYQKYDVMTKEMLKDYKAEYYKRLVELKRQHEVRLQAFETKKLEARQKFRESWTLDEVLETSCELPNTVKSADYQENATPLNSSSTEPIEKMQQLPSSRFLSSSKDFSSEYAISSQICIASTVFQNQASEKLASNLEVGSRTHRLVPPISNMVSGVVKAPSSSYTRNLSTQRVINNNHPVQTAVQSASRNVPPLCNDPFRNQLETIRKHEEQNEKTRQQMELQAKSNFEKEMKKIHAKFQEEREKTTYLKMMLAAAAKSNPEFPGASRMLNLQATSQNSYASAGSRTMVLSPALQTSYNTSEIFRDLSARLPISSASRNLQAGGEASHIPPYGPSTFIPASGVSGILHGMPSHPRINSISSFSRNLQAGVEIRTPAPHLYVPSTFIPSSCISGVPHGMPSRPAASLSQWLAKPMLLPPTTISKVGTHRWHGQENIGLSPHTHTLSFKDMHMNPKRR